MSRGPGLYSDFGKKARDLLFNGYNGDQKLTFTTYSPKGIVGATTSSCTNKDEDESFVADLNTQLMYKKLTTDIKLDTNSNLFTTLTVNEAIPGLKTILSFGIPKESSRKVEVQHLHDYHGFSASVGLAENPIANLSCVIGTDVLSTGVDLSYNTYTCCFTKFNAGLNFSKDNLVASLTFNGEGNVLTASYYHEVNPSTKTVVGAEVNYQLLTKENIFTFGAQHTLDSLTTIKGRFNNLRYVSGLIHREWRPSSFFTVSAELDTMGLKPLKVGLALSLKT